MWNQDWWGFAAYWRPEWTIPAAGVAAAVVAFSAGRTVVRVLRRGKDNAPVNLLADPAIQGSLKDQRAAMRRAGNPVGVQMRDPEGQGNELTAWVVDRSVGGLSLHMDSPLEVGSVWNVRPRNAPETASWVAVEVRSCIMEGGTWKVGCKFVKTPTWNVLMLFG